LGRGCLQYRYRENKKTSLKIMEENETNKTAFWTHIGQGICLFLLLFGVGTCSVGVGTCSALETGKIKVNVNINPNEQK